MQLSISEQAHQLIEDIDILLNSTQHLDDSFRNKLDKVSFKMNEFVTEYHTHLTLSISEYASYLNHDALSPLTIVLGYSELSRSIHAHLLTSDEIHLLTKICHRLRILTESLYNERDTMVAKRNQITASKT